MTQEISFAPARVIVTGATAAERKLSALDGASAATLMALSGAKGDVGKAARSFSAKEGQARIAHAASNANYRPVAEYLSAQLGEGFVISNRASFESLPDQFEQRIMKIKSAKNQGYRIDKNGCQAPTAALALAMTLKAECVDIIAYVADAFAKRAANRVAIDMAVSAL
jgi:hypothetical protein